MNISIVTTIFYSEKYLTEFYRRITKAVKLITDDYKIIFVNDGSPDQSLKIAVGLYGEDPKVKVIDLSRHFGHHKAIMTGLRYAKSDYVFLIDCDLEEQPELLTLFFEEMKQSPGFDVIYGVRRLRHGSLSSKITGPLFYKIFNFFSEHKIPENQMIARLMTRKYVNNLVEHKDKEVLLAGLWAFTGFSQKPVVVDKIEKGSSKYNLRRKISIVVNAVTSFSSRPLEYIFYMGFVILTISMIYIIHLLYRKIILNLPPPGYSSIIVSIWFLGGLLICSLGVVGIYVAKIFIETKDRPMTIIKEIYGRQRD